MPKGKKKGKKGGKDKAKKKEPPPPVKIEEEPLNESSKEFYLIQIRDLEQRVTRYQTKCDVLTVTNDDLQKKLTQQIEDQHHIMGLMKDKMREQATKCGDLEEQLAIEKNERLKEVDKLSKEMALIKEEAQDRLDQLVAENTVLHGTLDSLEEFKANKDRIEGELKAKEAAIKKQQKEFDDKIYQLEKQAVLDKDRLRKEMVVKVNSVASEFRKVSDLQMADTTKRTIQENISVTQQLHRMSEKIAELIRENEKLKERERDLVLRLEIMETSERDMTRKNVSNQKILIMMKDKVKEQEEAIKSMKDFKEKCGCLEKELTDSQHSALTLTHQLEFCKAELKSRTHEYEKLKEQYHKAKEELDSLKSLLKKTSTTIKSFIKKESQEQVPSSDLLPTLFELLVKAPTSKQNSSTSLLGSSSYQPGDLSIVPKRPSNTTLKRSELPPLNPMKS